MKRFKRINPNIIAPLIAGILTGAIIVLTIMYFAK